MKDDIVKCPTHGDYYAHEGYKECRYCVRTQRDALLAAAKAALDIIHQLHDPIPVVTVLGGVVDKLRAAIGEW